MTPTQTREPGTVDRALRWAGSWSGITTLAALVAAVVAVVLYVVLVVPTLDDCAPGVDRTGPREECVGISDTYAFDRRFAAAMRRIAAENERVEQVAEEARQRAERDDPDTAGRAEDRFVTLVYVLPVPVDENNLTGLQQHELEGGYLAQRAVNTSNAFGGDRPLVRLLVANSGENGEHTARIAERVRSYPASERVTALLGFDLSRGPVEEAIRSLGGRAGCAQDDPACDAFPVFTSLVTADGFAGSAAGGASTHVVRIAPTNGDQAAAAAQALAARGPYSAMIIQDTNPEDRYATTLGSRFTEAAAGVGAQLLGTENYDSAAAEAVPRRMSAIAEEVCEAEPRPDVVYFAGRAADLTPLVQAAAGLSACEDEAWRMNVWSGDDAVNADVAAVAEQDVVTLTFTTLAHPDVWTGESAGSFTPGRLVCGDRSGSATCFAREFGYAEDDRSGLEDSGAIIGYDVVVAAVQAIRRSAPEVEPVTRREVVSVGIPGLHGEGAVPGASGWISICDDGGPLRKAVPILEIGPEGRAVLRPGPVPAAGGAPYLPGSLDPC